MTVLVGNLMDEEAVLKWLIQNKETKDDLIEFVDKKMLDVLLDDVEHIIVYFCKNLSKYSNCI